MVAGPVDSMHAQTARRARFATAALFLTNGALFANLAPRLPEIKTDLGLDNTTYGLVVAAFPTGALAAGLLAGTLIRRFTSARMAVVGTAGIAVLTAVAASSPTAVLVALALFVGGASDAITDVAQNTHGLRVQRVYGRSIINSLHAIWSIGAVLGSAMAAAAIATDVPRQLHLVVTAVVFTSVTLIAYRFLLRGPDTDPEESAPGGFRGAGRRIYGALMLLVLIAVAGAVVEDAGSTWATLYLRDELGAAGAIAVFGYIALLGFQFIGRVLGDRLVDRFGERAVARTGGLVTAAGMGAALWAPSVPATIAGFAAAGIGIATAIPAAMHCADRLPGLRPGAGLTAVAWLMRVGFVGAPPLVGAVADATSLRVGLLIVPIAGVVVFAAAGVLSGRRSPTRS
ncbi:MFS transporter [Mycolicibacterium lacusdiani]|uniref:MFS transporter n=1 Tax=Mycolicibacterium lacusdiani TaxID=2895283 RepID=UPI001F28FD18|nr:MFS transporter [Mycolicibacterium lacusdiani]